MNAEEIQYALDRRNYVNLPLSDPDTDNVIDKPIQLGHLTGDVIIESTEWARINYLGPPGRAVFEYNYTGVQEPPRLFFKNIVSRTSGVGTYNAANMSFFRVIQPNTSPKFICAEHCDLANDGTYLWDGPDVCGCDGIQIKHCTGGGSGFMRWRLRHDATMLFLEIYDTRYQTSAKIGPSTDFKNTRGIRFVIFADEQRSDILEALNGNWAAPLSHRFVNPRGFNRFEHNWNEYATNWDVDAIGCWATSIRVDDVSGDYGMHYMRRYQSPFSGGSATGVNSVRYYGGHSDTNAGSLYVERLDSFGFSSNGVEHLAGKVFPKSIDPWDIDSTINDPYVALNATGITNRLEVYDQDGQPRLYGNTRDPIYNTQYRIDRTTKEQDYEDIEFAQSQKAYGGLGSVTTQDGSDIVITFNESSTLYVNETVDVEYLIAAGGGSGGCQNDAALIGGGGGAGGFASNFGGTKVTLSPGSYPIVVGAGGIFEWGTYGTGTDGTASSFNGITVPGGGGGGGSADLVTYTDGNSGGCGGGAAARGGTSGGAGSAYGYAGGSSDEASGSSGGSGGGGAGGVGGNGYLDSVPFGGNGGAGVQSSITGTARWYCEGGGGSTPNNNQGDGGVEGGGYPRTASENANERDGKRNLGGGGAGGAHISGSSISYPGNGSDGVVIIRFASA